MDRISELPHEILGSILSLLPLKEAVATSVLSRHLRYAWAWSTLTLDFDPEETLIDFKYHSRTLQNKKSHRVVGPSIALKYLKLDECDDLKRVEISNTNLLSFIHTGTAIDLRLSNVPSLVEVAITSQNNDIASLCASTAFMRLAFTQLSCCLYQLETLMINTQEALLTLFFGSQEYNKDYTFPILPNLKHLELTVEGDYKLSLSQLSFFMKASPYLQRLALKKAAKCPHHYIKVVEVFGYCGRTNAVEHVMFLMENVVALEKLVIVPYWSWDCHHSGSESGKRERKKEAKERQWTGMVRVEEWMKCRGGLVTAR
ncbi:Protein with RNI-like/FBD-like domains [Prunus dulcis]|uniref:Protein with RNI-like/FBD-like domains n=1 Tax=Prunus dulcis TaxID=3755 RepID=A0A4Y1RG34_PRUDU|nr:Protein with RNI-like/FBD-like domains [Prunus dulcis]